MMGAHKGKLIKISKSFYFLNIYVVITYNYCTLKIYNAIKLKHHTVRVAPSIVSVSAPTCHKHVTCITERHCP